MGDVLLAHPPRGVRLLPAKGEPPPAQLSIKQAKSARPHAVQLCDGGAGSLRKSSEGDDLGVDERSARRSSEANSTPDTVAPGITGQIDFATCDRTLAAAGSLAHRRIIPKKRWDQGTRRLITHHLKKTVRSLQIAP